MVAREIALDQAKGEYEVTVLQHINTKHNLTADPLSRQYDPMPPPFPTDRLRRLNGSQSKLVQISGRYVTSPGKSRSGSWGRLGC